MRARPLGGIGRRIGLKIRCRKACRFKSGRGHHLTTQRQTQKSRLAGARRLFLGRTSGRGRPGALLSQWHAGELEPAGEIRDDDERDRNTDQPEKSAFHWFSSLGIEPSGIRTQGLISGSGPLPGIFQRRFPGLSPHLPAARTLDRIWRAGPVSRRAIYPCAPRIWCALDACCGAKDTPSLLCGYPQGGRFSFVQLSHKR